MSKENSGFPSQKQPLSKKGTKWRKQCVDYFDNTIAIYGESIRKTRENKHINYNLYNGIVNINDIEKVCNPNEIKIDNTNLNNIQHYPIMVPRINVLLGEEEKRRYDFRAMVINANAVSEKENKLKAVLNDRIKELITSNYSEKELEKKLKELEKYAKYTYQDLREIRANQILRHYYKTLNFARKFNDGFKDALIAAEEIYQCDIVGNEPTFERLNPLNVHSYRSGNSNKVEDSDIIVLEDFWSSGKILDVFYDDLKESDVTKIEEANFVDGAGRSGQNGWDQPRMLAGTFTDHTDPDNNVDSLIEMVGSTGAAFSDAYVDVAGNIRVLRVYWRSKRKVKKVKYYDKTGAEQIDIFPESYIVKEDEGEELLKNLWINEWWEGTKIANDIYVNMRPRKVQYNKMENPSYCHPGIIGRIYNTNQYEAVSMVDRMKNLQYMYDVLKDRLNRAIAKNYGKPLIIDQSLIPDGWDIDQVMYFLVNAGIIVQDPFKEVNHGPATGTLAGNLARGGNNFIDTETGQYIQQHIMLLEYIKQEMGEISGVTEQRLGQVENRETVGGVERAVTQSSHVTEYWFSIHEEVKNECLRVFLETAKIALKGSKKKIQNILDDNSIKIFEIDGDSFAESDYDIVITAGNKTSEIEQTLKQLAHAALQNDKMNFSTLMDIFMSPSISEMRRRIETSEEEANEREAQAVQAQREAIDKELAQRQKEHDDKIGIEKYRADLESETKVLIASMNSDGTQGNFDPIAAAKLELDRQKRRDDLLKFNKQLQEDKRQFDQKIQVDRMKARKSPTKTS